jgi:hypothetical protein
MISIEKLAEILNNELNKEFLDVAVELYDDGDSPIDPEHPAMEMVLEKIVEMINDSIEVLPMGMIMINEKKFC